MKQTSIEWLQSKLPSLAEKDDNGFYADIFVQAKEMHKQEITDAYYYGGVHFQEKNETENQEVPYKNDAEKYYEELF
jgi:hypothetical protein